MTRPLIQAGDITTSTGTGTTGNVDHPAYGAGDLLIAFIGLDDDFTANNLQTPSTGPNGETLILDTTGSGGSSGSGPTQGAVAWVGTATQSAGSVDFTWTGSEFYAGRCIIVPAGEFDATTPLGALSGYSGNTSSTGTTIATPSWTLDSTDGGGAIVVHMVTDADPITGNPSGWTITVNTDHGGVASAITQRDADSVDSETVASVDYTISSDSSSTLGIVVRPPIVTHTADGSPSITIPTASGTAEVIRKSNVGTELVDRGLLVRYFYDEAASGQGPTTVFDRSGNGYDLDDLAYDGVNLFWTVTGNDRGIGSSGATHDGYQRHAIDNASDLIRDALDGAQECTFEICVVVDDITVSNSRLFCINDRIGGNPVLGITSNATDEYQFFFNKVASLDNNHDLSAGGVHVVTVIVNSAMAIETDRIRFYIDGVLDEAVGNLTLFDTISMDANVDLIGMNRESSGAYDRSFDGVLYYAAVYDEMLTASEIADNAAILLRSNDLELPPSKMPLPTAAGVANVESKTKTASGAPSIAVPTASGAAEVNNTATGAPSIAIPTASGAAQVIKKATGAVVIAAITAAGAAEILNTATGAPSIPLPTAAGNATVTAGDITADGAPSIAIPTAAGTTNIERNATGAPSITIPTAAGVAEVNNTATGSPSIAIPTAAGTASVEFAAKDTSVRVTFGTPTNPLATGVGLQRFNMYLRRDAAHVGGSGIPTVDVYLYEDGVQRGTALVSNVPITSDSGQVVTALWDAADLVTAADGSAVECFIDATAVGTGADKRAVEVGAVEWCSVAAQGNFANGAPAIPLPTAAGTTDISRSATGAPSITLPTAAGVAEVIKTATGAPEIAIPTASGAAIDLIPANGAPEIAIPTAAGVAEILNTATGAPSIPLPTAAGTTDIERTANGAPSIAIPTAAGVAFIGVTATGAPEIAIPTAAGTAEIIKTADGAPAIPLPTAAGVAELTNTASGAPEIAIPTASGAATFVQTATGAPEIAIPTAAGVAEVGNLANGAPEIAIPTAAGTTALTRFANGAPSIPAIRAAGVAQVGELDVEVGGGSHGAYVPTPRKRPPELPEDDTFDQSMYDDAELVLLAVKIIEDHYE